MDRRKFTRLLFWGAASATAAATFGLGTAGRIQAGKLEQPDPGSMDSFYQELRETHGYPETVLETEVDGTHTVLIGVDHTEQFFNEYEAFYREAVTETDTLCIEELWHDESGFAEFAADERGAAFFQHVSDIAREQEKTAYQVDPRSVSSHALHHLVEVGTIAYIASRPYRFSKDGETFPRRELPSQLGKTGIAGYFFLGGKLGSLTQTLTGDDRATYDTWDTVLHSHQFDYANLFMAEGVERVARERSDDETLLGIYGDAHVKPILTYLKNPELYTKKHAYLPERILTREFVEEYNPTEEGWELVETF